MKKYSQIFNIVILSMLIASLPSCMSQGNSSAAAQDCKDNRAPVRLGEQTLFCIGSEANGKDIKQRDKEIESRLKKIADNFSSKTESIEFNSTKKAIMIDDPDNNQNPSAIITFLDLDTDTNNIPLDESLADPSVRLIKSAVDNYRIKTYGSRHIIRVLDEPKEQNEGSNLEGLIIGIAIGIAIGIFISIGIYKQWISERRKPPTQSLAGTIKLIKEQIYKVQEEAATASENAMFALGPVTVNLKTVLDDQLGIKVVGELGKLGSLENSIGFSNEQTQHLTLVLNPLKVFSEKVGTLKVTYKENRNDEYYEGVTEADMVNIKDNIYLWIRTENQGEKWIDASNIIEIKTLTSQAPQNAKILEILFKKHLYNAKTLSTIKHKSDFLHKFTDEERSLEPIANSSLANIDWQEVTNIFNEIKGFYNEFKQKSEPPQTFKGNKEYLECLTIKTLNELDGAYKKFILRFLYDKNHIKTSSTEKIELKGADLRNIDLIFIQQPKEGESNTKNWSNIDLHETDLTEANLSILTLTGANLRWANLKKADLSGANLKRADLSMADLQGVSLIDVENLDSKDIKSIIIKASQFDMARYKADEKQNRQYIDDLILLDREKDSLVLNLFLLGVLSKLQILFWPES